METLGLGSSPFTSKPATVKESWKPSFKFAYSMDHSVKGYADDATLISTNFDTHSSVLQESNRLGSNAEAIQMCLISF